MWICYCISKELENGRPEKRLIIKNLFLGRSKAEDELKKLEDNRDDLTKEIEKLKANSLDDCV